MARARAGLAIAAALAALVLAFAVPAQNSRDAQRKLDRAQRELQAVAAERRRIEGQRGAASRQLRAVDERLGRSSRSLRETEARLAQQQAALAQLQQQRATLQSRLGEQRQALARLLRAAYTIGGDAPLKLLLAQDSVADADRVLTWHRYLQRDRARRIAALAAELQALDALEQRIAEQQRALDATRASQHAQLAQLQDDRQRHVQTVARLETRYRDRRSRERALGSDVAGLKQLLARLRAAAARAEAERRAAAQRAAHAPGKPGQARPKPPLIANAAPVRVGGLGWPLSGNLLAGYGGTLPDGGRSAGLLIGAPTGATVKAVANGKVVFADWMNGYGLILIVDHGNGYMSLYARNEALLRDAGDDVKRGDALASVGSSGGAGPPALYFELRRNGDPVDPRVWLQKQ